MIRRYFVLSLCGLAGLYGAWQGIRIAFFPVGTSVTVSPNSGIESTQPVFLPAGLLVLGLILTIYALVVYTVYRYHYTEFRLIAGLHIILSVLSLPSFGSLFIVSSGLLLVAIVLSIGLLRTSALRQLRST